MTSHRLLADANVSILSDAAAGGVNLDFDLTFVVQMVAFTALVLILKPLLFEPLLQLFEERERRTEGAKLLARKMDERAGELLTRYEQELERVRRVAGEERDLLREQGQKLEARIVAEARAAAAQLLVEGKAKLEAEKRSLQAELMGRSNQIAREIASRVLGRELT
jgi:F-type H+-transporting ATPase subunit b